MVTLEASRHTCLVGLRVTSVAGAPATVPHMAAHAGITTGRATANGIDFTFLECGTGPLALCLHGFPDSAHSWRHLLPALAAAGFRAVAPFTRGYAPTSTAADGYYATGTLAADANALHEVLGGSDDAVIIGHDWGAPSAYGAAGRRPDLWRRVVGMAVPPGPAFSLAFMTNQTQLKRSWYMFFFQHALADLVVPANDLAFIDMLWADWSPGFAGSEDIDNVKRCLRDPENLSAALGYYRATLGDAKKDPAVDEEQRLCFEAPPQPTLYLHGVNDGCCGKEVAESAKAMCPDVTVQFVGDAGHFLQVEQPEIVNQLVVDWVTTR
jgi:pimeloyl-ACP methyl ester carboxylesterase